MANQLQIRTLRSGVPRAVAMRFLALAGSLCLAAMVACGGGGGGGGTPDPGLSINPSSISLTAQQWDPAPPVQTIHITITSPDAVYVGAAWAGATPAWITVTGLNGSGRNWDLGLQITDTSLSPGTYTATLRTGVAKSDQTIIGTRDAVITYRVTGSLDVTPGSLSFEFVQGGAPPTAQSLAITGSAGNWTASANQSWITLGSTSGTAPTSLNVQINPTGLGLGLHSGIVTIQATTGGSVKQIPVTLSVTAPGLQASASQLSFSGVHGNVQTAHSLSIAMNTGSNTAWTASTDDAWVVLSKGAGATPDSITVTVDSSHGSAAGGIYHSKIHFSGTYGGVPVTQVVDVDLNLSAAALTVDTANLSFSGINGTPLSAQNVNLGMNNGVAVNWTAISSSSWLVLSKASGTTSDLITVSVDPTQGPLASNDYTGTITLQGSYGGATLSKVVNVSLSLTKPTLSLSAASLVLGGANGRDTSPQQVQFSLNTGGEAHPWAVTPSAAWMGPSLSSGTVSGSGTTLDVSLQRGGQLGGTYAGTLDLAVTVNGDLVEASLPVTLNLEAHKLLASDTGVSFASMPTLAKTTRTLQVKDNFGQVTTWTASSDQAWLSVTPSGATPGGLVLTGDPVGLTPNTIHYATVSLGTPDASVENAETIKVGFWVGSADPAASTTINTVLRGMVADPIRPFAYVHNGGSTLTVYNIYTCEVVGTIPSVAAQIGDMTVSNDGSTLFVTDNTNFQIVPVDLQTRTVGTPWAVGSPIPAYIQYVRTSGKEILVLGNRSLLDARTGAFLGGDPLGGGYNYQVAASLSGDRIAIGGMVYALDYTSLNGGRVILGPPQGGGGNNDFAFNNEGTRYYSASGSPYYFPVYDASSTEPSLPLIQNLPGNAYPNNVEVARDGRIFCGIFGYGPPDVWVYAPNGAELARYHLSYYGTTTRQLKVSGDSLRMLAFGNDGYFQGSSLIFTTVSP